MLAQILTAIKDITGFRFYFLVTVLAVGFFTYTFKDDLKQFSFKPRELQEISNEKGLQTTLAQIKHDDPLVKGYIFFLYQPKHDSYFKKLVITDIGFVKENSYFKAMPLNAQKYLNYLLIQKEYAILDYNDPQATDYISTYNSDYVFVYNVYSKETIAEVILTFDVKPTKEEIALLIKRLRPIKYFVI